MPAQLYKKQEIQALIFLECLRQKMVGNSPPDPSLLHINNLDQRYLHKSGILASSIPCQLDGVQVQYGGFFVNDMI